MSEVKEIKALRVLRLQGVGLPFQNACERILETLVELGVPEDDAQVIKNVFNSLAEPASIAEFKEILTPAYTSRFSEEELDSLIESMNTPAYQKFIAEQQDIASSNTTKSLQWVREKISPILQQLDNHDESPFGDLTIEGWEDDS